MPDKNSGFFQNVGTAIFKPVGDFFGGAVTALQPGRTQQMRRKQQNQVLINDLKIIQRIQNPQDKLMAFQALMQKHPQLLQLQERFSKAAFERQYAANAITPEEKIDKLALAGQRLKGLGANEAADAVIGKINELTGVQPKKAKEEKGAKKSEEAETALADYFKGGLEELEAKSIGRASQEQVDEFAKGFQREAEKQGIDARNAEILFGELYKEERGKAGILRDDGLPRRDVIDHRGLFSDDIDRLIQDSTETLPNENIPRTFEQLGITNTDDMNALQEMQKAMPDIDMRWEYEQSQRNPDDKKRMEGLIELWKKRKITIEQLRKSFSLLQKKAKQALGTA